jgi:microcystin-dependent protein
MSGFTNINGDIAPPVGSIIAYAGTTSPNGWLLCDGEAYSMTTYATLFNVIGTRYGTSGSNFNVPDLRTRVIRGSNNTGVLNNTTNGTDDITLAISNIPSHTHTYQDAAFVSDGGSKPGGNMYGDGAATDGNNGYYWRKSDGTLVTTPSDLTSGSTGSGTSFSIIPKNLQMNYIIKY